MNDAVYLLNDFIHYRNKQFKPTLSDEEVLKMIQIPKDKLTKCQGDIYSVGDVGVENATNLSSLKNLISTTLAQAEEHSVFVKNYLNKSNLVRKTMFLKVLK